MSPWCTHRGCDRLCLRIRSARPSPWVGMRIPWQPSPDRSRRHTMGGCRRESWMRCASVSRKNYGRWSSNLAEITWTALPFSPLDKSEHLFYNPRHAWDGLAGTLEYRRRHGRSLFFNLAGAGGDGRKPGEPEATTGSLRTSIKIPRATAPNPRIIPTCPS